MNLKKEEALKQGIPSSLMTQIIQPGQPLQVFLFSKGFAPVVPFSTFMPFSTPIATIMSGDILTEIPMVVPVGTVQLPTNLFVTAQSGDLSPTPEPNPKIGSSTSASH